MKACRPRIQHNAGGDKNRWLPSKTDFMRSSLFLRLLWRPCRSSAATRASLTTLSPSCTGGRSGQDNLDTLIRLAEHIDSGRTGLCPDVTLVTYSRVHAQGGSISKHQCNHLGVALFARALQGGMSMVQDNYLKSQPGMIASVTHICNWAWQHF